MSIDTGRRSLLAASAALALGGCGSPPPAPPFVPPSIDESSFVYGYIDMADAPSNLTQVQVKRLRPFTSTPFYEFGVHQGVFYRVEMPMGAYKVTRLTGIATFGGVHRYNFERQGKGELDREITSAGMVYLGAWKYKAHKKGWLEQDEFDLLPLTGMTEREVLERILAAPAGWSKPENAPWRQRIERRLAQLGGQRPAGGSAR